MLSQLATTLKLVTMIQQWRARVNRGQNTESSKWYGLEDLERLELAIGKMMVMGQGFGISVETRYVDDEPHGTRTVWDDLMEEE